MGHATRHEDLGQKEFKFWCDARPDSTIRLKHSTTTEEITDHYCPDAGEAA